jgi:hypothetical protein
MGSRDAEAGKDAVVENPPPMPPPDSQTPVDRSLEILLVSMLGSGLFAPMVCCAVMPGLPLVGFVFLIVFGILGGVFIGIALSHIAAMTAETESSTQIWDCLALLVSVMIMSSLFLFWLLCWGKM